MNKNAFLILLFFFVFSKTIIADAILYSWSSNSIQYLTPAKLNEAKDFSVNQIIQKNLSVQTWCDTYLLLIAVNEQKNNKELLESLVNQLTEPIKVNLTGTSRLIIWERITSGDILFEGKGYQVDDDLFSLSGRANWLLKNITKKNFGVITPSSTSNALKTLQQKWREYLDENTVEEYISPYKNAVMPVITSKAAIEALITSLKPNKEKEQKTKDCLKRMYNLEEMPKDDKSPAKLCNPDTYTIGWLLVLMGDNKCNTNDEWINLWKNHKNNISWNSDIKKFEIRSN